VIVAAGRLERHAANDLQQRGFEVRLLDANPANLHALAQQGIKTLTGDARNENVLRRAGAFSTGVAFVCLNDDEVAAHTVELIHNRNPSCWIMCRCRYHDQVRAIKDAGSQVVICDETEATDALGQWLSQVERPQVRKISA
jgi:Trk K+ transport system NAD-binding subunit